MALLLTENSRLWFKGPSPKGPFDIDADQAMKMLAGPVNVNGKPNSNVIRQVISAIDIFQHNRKLWTIDFGSMDQEVAAMYEQPFEWVLAKVKPVRETNRRDNYRLRWRQYGEAAKRLNELRENWLNPEGASEAELKKRTLTNLYNARPQWLVNVHGALDRAVWDAYGWDDADPAAVEEDVILSRLLQLNQERSAR